MGVDSLDGFLNEGRNLGNDVLRALDQRFVRRLVLRYVVARNGHQGMEQILDHGFDRRVQKGRSRSSSDNGVFAGQINVMRNAVCCYARRYGNGRC